jgi:cobalamin biosynthesis protein CobT
MEGMDYDDLGLDDTANIILGFIPNADFTKMSELAKDLNEYITDNPIFEGVDFSKNAEFYSGISWEPEDDDDETYEEESDEESDDEEESDEESDEEDDEEADESDENETKISPSPKNYKSE